MSLATRIKSDAKLRKKIDATFARPTRDEGRTRLVDPPGSSPGTSTVYRADRVGTAFDYLFRLALRQRNPAAGVIERTWVAENVMEHGHLSLDWPYGEQTREAISAELGKWYLWEEFDDGLDCLPHHSRLFPNKGYWVRNMKDSELQQGLPVHGLYIPDKWLAARLREDLSFQGIVDALFESLGQHRRRISAYREAIAGARYCGERFVRTGEMTNRLPHFLLKISNLDVLHRTMRANFLPPAADAIFVERIPQREIDDLLALYEAIPGDLLRGESVWLNPDLSVLNRDIRPKPRKIVGGGVKADADLIVDDLLIDIKTSRKRMTPMLPLQDFCQLMGYFALAELEGTHRIRRLGIYYARYGYLFEFPVPRARPGTGGRAAYLEWFRKQMRIDKRRVPEFTPPHRRR